MLSTVSNSARVWLTSSFADAIERTSSVVRSATSYRRCMSAWSASTVAWRWLTCSSARVSCDSTASHLASRSSNCAIRFCANRSPPARLSSSSSVALQVLRRFVERRLTQLQLLAEGAGAVGESLEILRAPLEHRDGRIDFGDSALRAIYSGHGRRHHLLDAGRLVGVGSERREALVGPSHARVQLATALVELGAERVEVGKTLVQVLDHATARVDLRHRFRQPIRFAPH